MGDGQALVKLSVAEPWLRSVDAAIAAFGGSRATGEACKSVARLLVPGHRAGAFQGWADGYIADTCRVVDAATSGIVTVTYYVNKGIIKLQGPAAFAEMAEIWAAVAFL